MKIARYVDKDWHHYCVRNYQVADSIFLDFNIFTTTRADKKFSYLQDFEASEQSLELLESKIRQHLKVSDHVFVGFGEPLIVYKDKEKHGWDHEHNVAEGPYYHTNDFINKFATEDKVTFFANLISHVPLNRPMHYLNDMFFQDINIYKKYDLCKDLLDKLIDGDKKCHWELMCSHLTSLYHKLKKHPVDSKTFSTCHALGISHWGPDVIAPSDKMSGAEAIAKDHNIRVSDLIDPSIYNQSHYSCVVETVIPEDNRMSMFSEKQAKPIITKRPFIIVGTKDHLKAFRDLGFKTFSPIIDESYDDEPDRDKRLTMILDSMNKLTEMSTKEVYEKLAPVLQHNYDHFYNNKWNEQLFSAWFTPNLLSE